MVVPSPAGARSGFLGPKGYAETDISPLALTPEELGAWLEWAGSKLLAMNIASPFPKEPNSAWPEFASDPNVAYGYTGERIRPAIPGRYEIDLMDQILALSSLATDITARRIINARALVAPITRHYLYSWRRIAEMLHTSPFRVKQMHARGLKEIVKLLPKEKTHLIRQLLTTHS